jgi:cytochrome d ubiquinol oxidase subunit I
LLPQAANQLGWISAEVGRQPWIVYNLLRTKDAVSKAVGSGEIIFSLILFTLIYALLFVLFIFLLDRKIKHGPDETDERDGVYSEQKAIFNKK